MNDRDSYDDWEHAYLKLLPLFFVIIRKLAAQGYIAAFGQGMDIVHDFFLEEWPKVNASFDPTKGELNSYAGKAFVRFARRRLTREARWLRVLDPVNVVEAAESHEAPYDLHRAHEALASLCAEDRTLLETWFGSKGQSERELSKRYKISRYALRQRLAKSMARFVIALGEQGEFLSEDLVVARSLFVDLLTVQQVADSCGKTNRWVRRIRDRLLSTLLECAQ